MIRPNSFLICMVSALRKVRLLGAFLVSMIYAFPVVFAVFRFQVEDPQDSHHKTMNPNYMELERPEASALVGVVAVVMVLDIRKFP